MLKRGNPFTPSPVVTHKKTREYASPTVRTPLRNVLEGSKEALMKESQTPPRTPLNDDEQERRANRAAMVQNRRQMKKTLLSPAVTTPKANPPSMATPKYSPLTPSAIRPEVATKPVAAQKLTMEQRNKMFEEWMKIAADNKINAKNSWNVALIDYFSELTFLRDGDSINFQKASCTLDGCVKIYATRVDSVADETGKLLNGLAEGGKSKRSLDFLAEPTENDDPKKLKLTSKRPHRAVDTLEKSFEALDLKNFEMEFAVDPLFKKMCAEFDESGTRGFLTCSLSLDDRGQLMFDSSESTKLTELRNLEEMNEENMVDTSQLMLTHGKALADIGRRTVLPSLGEFSFGLPSGDGKMTNAMTKLTTMTMNAIMDVDSDDDHPDGIHEELEEVIPLNDDYDEMPMPVAESESREQRPRGKFTEEVDSDEYGFSTTTTSSFLAYFDSKIQRNWAGPEHWKIQRPHLARSSPSSLISAKPKALKKEFTLDFNTDPVDISAIFVKANPVSITLSKSSLDERSTRDNLLPDDLHFSSSELLKLFIKPSWTIGRRRITVEREASIDDRPDLIQNEVESSYWADPQPNIHPEEMTVPLNDDPYDNDDYDNDYDNDNDGYDYGSDEPPLPDHPNTLPIGDDLVPIFRAQNHLDGLLFTRRAKKVDVQELKRVLWQEIESLTKKRKQPDMTFSSLVNKLDESGLSREMLKDVSVPYCFICLLHLANEHNLELKSNNSGELLILSS